MSVITPVLSFPGIPTGNMQSAIITRSNGTRPGIALVNAVPNGNNPDTSGAASFVFGTSSNALTWTNALCDLGTIQPTSQGQVQRFVIFDRRWRWRRGSPVTGAYNVRDPQGNIISSTQKTLAQLATILFTAMGEGSADVSGVSSTEYPMVVWDRDNPADELAELLEPRGYVISLQYDDSVKVFQSGSGATLPANQDVTTTSITVNTPEVPSVLRVVCGRTLVQSMLKCVPIGEDTDGTLKPVASLSYSPGIGSTGWDGLELNNFNFISDPVSRDLAMKTVGKYFQVVGQADGSQNLSYGGVNYLGGEITVTQASQLLPLKPFLLTSTTDQFGRVIYDEAFVSGVFYGELQANPPINGNSNPFTRVDKRDWTLKADYGIVVMKQPAVKKNGSSQFVFADVFITCTYSVHDNTTMVKDRLTRDLSLGGYGYEVAKLDELQRTLTASYTSGTSTLSGLNDTKSTVNAEADLYLNAAANNYTAQIANVVTYRDCYAFGTDGVNLQVQWHIATGDNIPFSTQVSQYAESLPFIPTGAERQVARATRRAGSATNKQNKKWLQSTYGAHAPGGGGLGFN